MSSQKVLVFDTETAPITGYIWGMYDQNLGLNQIKTDWHFLAWGAKWLDSSKTMYMDNSKVKDITNDKALVEGLWKLLDEADVVIAHNGDKFDIKKFNARAVIHGLPPPRPFKSTDTLKETRKVFSHTSNTLEYLTSIFNKKYKKLKHKEYPGFELWKEVLGGSKHAWQVMKKYCIHDVLSTDEYYKGILGWIKTQNMAVYYDDNITRCICGSSNVTKKGFVYIRDGKYQGYKCWDCNKRPHGRVNLLSKEKKQSLLKDTK